MARRKKEGQYSDKKAEISNGITDSVGCDSNVHRRRRKAADGWSDDGQFFDNSESDLLSVEGAAQLLDKKPQTIRNWIAKRQFPFIKVGNRHMVLRESLNQWLKRKEFRPWA